MSFPADEFVIVSENNPALVLDIEGASHAQGGKLITWGYHGGPNQRFRYNLKPNFLTYINIQFNKRFGPNGSIVNVGSGHVLDVEGGIVSGRSIIQYAHHGGENQKWRIHKVYLLVQLINNSN